MAEALNYFKTEYKTRFCHGGGTKIDVQPGQNILKVVQDCFESCGSDFTVRSPSATRCSTPIVRKKRKTSLQKERPKAGLTNSVKKACPSAEPLPASPPEAGSSTGGSHEAPLKPAIHDCVAVSKQTESPVSERETNNILKDAEAPCRSPAVSSDPEDDCGPVGLSLLEEGKSSPVHVLHFDDRNTPAVVKSHMEVENLKAPQTGRDKKVALVEGTETVAKSSVQREKSFSSAVLAAVSTGTHGKRYSASISPPYSSPGKDRGQEVENECEFLIDGSDDVSFKSWFSIPRKNKKLKKDAPATPVPTPQLSGKEKTESKKRKSRKGQVKEVTKQKVDDLDVKVPDFRGTPESHPVSNSGGKVPKSQRRNRTPAGKTGKAALRRGSSKQKKDMSQKPEAGELLLPQSGLKTKASDAGQCKTRVMPSEDLPMPSAEHQQEQIASPKKNLKSSKKLPSASKAAQHLVHKKPAAKQRLPKDTAAKRLTASPRKKLKKSGQKSSNKKPELQREESSDSEPGEEELEGEPVQLNEVFTSPQHQTPAVSKPPTSEQPENISHMLQSLGAADSKMLVKALQYILDSVKNSERKRLPASSSGSIPRNSNRKARESVRSNPESTDSQAESDSSSEQGRARKKLKLADVETKSNKRKRGMQHGPQDSLAAVGAVSRESGPVLEHNDKFASRSKSCEQNNTSTDISEDLNAEVRALLSDHTASQKIVMPSNTPNVRRTKRIRLRPLEYWRGERVNYMMGPSGNLVISGIVCPGTKPHRKSKQKRDDRKRKRNEKSTEVPANLGHNLADTSKPTVVLDPATNEEVLLECVNTETSHSCFFKDEMVEIHKNLNAPAFASGKLILKPLKEKGHQFVHMDTIAFYVIHGKVIVTLHKTSYYLTTGDFFYVPAGNGYNIRNLLNEESVLLFTQLKKDRPEARDLLPITLPAD